ncbi:MAG TPA: rod shape-determining protein MreC [Peptococcaceae bacterium]|nr:rod shape-determining protein MreC [Peptococcaceae bacterium]
MSRKGALWAMLMVIALIIMLYIMGATNWGHQDMVSLGKPLREVAYPFQQGVTVITDGLKDFFGYFKNNENLRAENEKLQAQLDAQKGSLLELKETRAENQRLNELLEYKKSNVNQYNLELAKVIGRNPSNWYQTIIINVGSGDGIKIDMPVVTALGLVGRVVAVTAHTAEVHLLVDNESAVGARILETRDTPGVVEGDGQSNTLEMIHLPHDEAIAAGQTIITSGFSSIFPKGLPIGMVREVNLEPNGLTQTAVIEPFVDFSRLEEVMVIRQVLAVDSSEASVNPDDGAEGGTQP